MSNNLELWGRWAEVPKEAQKTIGAGRLKGMTDINPMWRIKQLTEVFGMCGMGWKAPIKAKWLDTGATYTRDGQTVTEIVANVEIELWVRDTVSGDWCEPITGIGGSMFVAGERNGVHTSDEAYKMAYTDAISVACKSLGIGANVYWAAGRSKYSDPAQPSSNDAMSELKKMMNYKVKTGMTAEAVTDALKMFCSTKEWNEFSESEAKAAIEYLKVLE